MHAINGFEPSGNTIEASPGRYESYFWGTTNHIGEYLFQRVVYAKRPGNKGKLTASKEAFFTLPFAISV